MSSEQTKELLYNILQALQRGDADYAETLAQGGISRINAASHAAPMLTKQLNQEADGEILFAATAKRGR